MRSIIGLDCTLLRAVARGVRVCCSSDTERYLSAANTCKFVRSGFGFQHLAGAYCTMTSVIEGKKSAAQFAVDKCIKVLYTLLTSL